MEKFLSNCISELLSFAIFETKIGVILVSIILSIFSLLGVGASNLYEWIGFSAYILTFISVFVTIVLIIELGKCYILKTSKPTKLVLSIKNGDVNILYKENISDTLLRAPIRSNNSTGVWPVYVVFNKRLRNHKIEYDTVPGTKIRMVNSVPGDKVAFAEFVIESQDGQFSIDFNSR